MRLTFVAVAEWPPLAWLAVCSRSSPEVTCFVGNGVETAGAWFGEGVWAGPFAEGALDETDLVFGSGGRVRGGSLVFVSAGSTLDRLHSLERSGEVWVSNSLPCVLARAGGSLDVGCRNLRRLFASVRNGLERYARELPTTVGAVRVTYFDNLAWDGTALTETAKPCAARDFTSYARFRDFLDTSMAAIAGNARAAERARPFGLMSTLSTGYDSPAIAVLAQQAGCDEAFGFDRSPIGQPDSGAEIAERLGLRFHELRVADAPNADIAFLAGGAGHGGSVSFKSAEPLLSGRVVFTGFHGDKVWDKHTEALGPDIVRGDTSGSDLTEYRLWAGFVNCAVPFWGVRQIADIHAIGNSPELAPWDTGTSYSRPICRRIVEERGVPREAFGMRKRGMFRPIPGPASFLTPELRDDYFAWLRSRRWEWIRRGQVPPAPWADTLGAAARRLRRTPTDPAERRRLHDYVIHWAVDRAKARYL